MKKTNKKRSILAIGLIIVMAVLLAACGSDKKKDSSDVVKDIEKKWENKDDKVTGKVTFDDWGKVDEDDIKPSSSIVNDAENAA